MAYVLGYIFADGSLEDSAYIRGKYLRISSTDQSSIVNIRAILGSEHKIAKTLRPKNHKPYYLLRIGSHKIFNDLEKYGLYPHKSLTIKLPLIPKKYTGDFVRGYFDGDGCIHIERSKTGHIKCMRLVFSSGSLGFLSKLSEILASQYSLTPRKIYLGTRSYQLRYSTHDSEKLFNLMYKNTNGIFLDRKLNKFLEYFRSRSNKNVGKSLGNILRYHRGLVAKG